MYIINTIKRNPTILSIIIAFLFACQHPFSQFLAEDVDPISTAIFSYVITVLFYILYIIYSRRSRFDLVRICRNSGDLMHVFFICLVGLLSIVTYFAALHFNKNLVIAVLLFNTSPVWSALWDYLFNREKPPAGFVFYIIIAFFGVIISLLGPVMFGAAPITEVGWSWLWAIPVPALFTLSVTLTTKWLAPPYENGAAVAASTFLGGLLYIMGLVVLSQSGAIDARTLLIGDKVIQVGWSAILMFIVGTVAQTAAARILLQHTLRLPDVTFSYVSSYWLLIPSISAVIILLIGTLRRDTYELPNRYQIVGIIFVAFGLYLNHRAREREKADKP